MPSDSSNSRNQNHNGFVRVDNPKKYKVSDRLSCICRISPEQAGLWLALNLGNRRVRKMLVGYLKRQIENKEWCEEHPQPICFSDTGRLIDGQHRLEAIRDSEIEVWARVEFGVPDKMRQYLDTGISRALEDRIQLIEDLGLNRTACQIVTAWFFLLKGMKDRPSPEDAQELFLLHKKSITWMAANRKHDDPCGRVYVLLAMCEFYERDEDKAAEFYESLKSLGPIVQPAGALKNFLYKKAGHSNRSSNREQYGKTVACCKAFLSGKTIECLRAASWE